MERGRMKVLRLIEGSLKARLVLFTIAITLGGAIASGLYVSRLLRSDLQKSITAQQFAVSRMMAQTIDRHVQERMESLEQVALLAGLRMGQGPRPCRTCWTTCRCSSTCSTAAPC
jgi:hypothetical protein